MWNVLKIVERMNKRAVHCGIGNKHSKLMADEHSHVSSIPFVVISNIFTLLKNICVNGDLNEQMVTFHVFS